MRFKGFQLIKLERAVGSSSPEHDTDITHAYEVIRHDVFGRKFKEIMTLSELNRDWGKEVRMNKSRFAILHGGRVQTLTETSYDEYVGKAVAE